MRGKNFGGPCTEVAKKPKRGGKEAGEGPRPTLRGPRLRVKRREANRRGGDAPSLTHGAPATQGSNLGEDQAIRRGVGLSGAS